MNQLQTSCRVTYWQLPRSITYLTLWWWCTHQKRMDSMQRPLLSQKQALIELTWKFKEKTLNKTVWKKKKFPSFERPLQLCLCWVITSRVVLWKCYKKNANTPISCLQCVYEQTFYFTDVQYLRAAVFESWLRFPRLMPPYSFKELWVRTVPAHELWHVKYIPLTQNDTKKFSNFKAEKGVI